MSHNTKDEEEQKEKDRKIKEMEETIA